jgi:uncharacterized protein with GYD domain
VIPLELADPLALRGRGARTSTAVEVGLAQLAAQRLAPDAELPSNPGTLDCFYYAFGDSDCFVIGELPDDASATVWSLMINSTGAVNVNLVPLMTPEDLDAAASKTPSYRAPGA